MDQHAISQQLLMEHEILAHVTSALRTTLGWSHPDRTRSLDTVRFVAQSFDRHLQRLMAMEERDGYLAVVVDSHPEASTEVETLQAEHGKFRHELSHILGELDHLDPADRQAYQHVTRELLSLLDELEQHGSKETQLLQDALLTDEGGEG